MDDSIYPLRLYSTPEFQRKLFNAMMDGLLVVDQAGLIIECNPAFYRHLGYEKYELLGMPATHFVTPSFSDKLHEQISRISTVGGETTFETACVHKDGSVMQMELNIRQLEVEGGVFLLGIVRDITQRYDLAATLKENLDVFKAAINTPALGFWATDMQGRFLDVNDAYVDRSGYSREELLGKRIVDMEAIERPEEMAKHIERVVRTGYDRFRCEHRRKDSAVWPVEIVTSYSAVQGGRFFSFIEDASEKNAHEKKLELASRVFETMEQAVIVTDMENCIISINPAAVRITGYSLMEVLGKNPSVFSSGRHDRHFYREMWDSLNRHGLWEGEIWGRRKDGEVYAKWQSIKVIYDKNGKVYQYVSVFSDITQRKKMEEGTWRQANFDSLTGMANRYLLIEHLEREIKKAQRSGSSLAVLYIDLDHFKEVNDTLGHAKGDEVLVQAARRISGSVRNTDTVARLGGDEFTALLPDFGGRENLQRIAQDLIKNLAKPYSLGDGEFAYVSASIGVTLYPDDASDLSGLLKRSDQAMYAAKAEGRNRFSYFTSSMQEDADEKCLLTNDLRQAIAKQQLQLYFQPIVDLSNGRVIKAEALLRWCHPNRGMVSPMIFIPLAEGTGLIHQIGNWVFQQAIASIERWQKRHGCTIQVSVNKSPIQFDRTIEPSWAHQLDRLGLPGNCIMVEITEGSLLRNSKNIKNRLLEFRNTGIEISIDDFGTGYSALSSLNQFDIDYLKIDRSFVSDIQNKANNALIEAIIVMAHKLGIKTIAEGVETESQVDLLKRFGCDYAQGYHYAKPLHADEFERLLSKSLAAGSTL